MVEFQYGWQRSNPPLWTTWSKMSPQGVDSDRKTVRTSPVDEVMKWALIDLFAVTSQWDMSQFVGRWWIGLILGTTRFWTNPFGIVILLVATPTQLLGPTTEESCHTRCWNVGPKMWNQIKVSQSLNWPVLESKSMPGNGNLKAHQCKWPKISQVLALSIFGAKRGTLIPFCQNEKTGRAFMGVKFTGLPGWGETLQHQEI